MMTASDRRAKKSIIIGFQLHDHQQQSKYLHIPHSSQRNAKKKYELAREGNMVFA